jgi:hypothetical protein
MFVLGLESFNLAKFYKRKKKNLREISKNTNFDQSDKFKKVSEQKRMVGYFLEI